MAEQSLAKSTLWLVASEIIFNLSGYIIHSFVGRILGPSDYGRYGLVVTLTTMVIILIGNGIPTAMAKYISEVFEKDASMVLAIKRKAVIIQTVLIGAITVLFFLSAPLLSKILGDPSLTPLFRISTLIIPAFAAASFYFSFFTGLHRFNIQSILKTLRSVLKILAIVGLAYAFSVPGSIVGYALAAFCVFLAGFSLDQLKYTKELKKAAKSQNLAYKSRFETKKLLNYAWQIVVFFLAYELLISIDLYMVKGILHDDYLTGIYNASLTVGRIPYYVFYALTIMLLPVISKTTSQNDRAGTNKIIGQSLRIMLVLLVPSVILLSEFAEPVIRIFFGKGYAGAAYPMSILAYGVGFLTIFYVMSFVLNGAGKTKIPMWISIFAFFLNASLNYYLINKYALAGSAIATTITSFIAMLAILYFIRRSFGKIMGLGSIARIVFAGFAMYLLSVIFPKNDLVFVLWSAILFATYLMILVILGEIGKDDLEYLKKIISGKKKEDIEEELSGNEPSV